MQRLLAVLTALLSFMVGGPRVAMAQQPASDGALVPSGAGTASSRSGSDDAGHEADGGGGARRSATRDTSVRKDAEPVVIQHGDSQDNVSVHGRPLVISGSVRHDVIAVGSDVTVEPGGSVSGHLVMVGGRLHNLAGRKMHVVAIDPRLSSVFSGAPASESSNALAFAPRANTAHATAKPPTHSGSQRPDMALPRTIGRLDWLAAQLGLLLFGILGALILQTLAPRAGRRVSERVATEPGRCLAVGAVGALCALMIAIINGGLIGSLGTLYAPLCLVVVVVLVAVVSCGWLCAMHAVGDYIARRTDRSTLEGPAARTALALVVFCVLESALGMAPGKFGIALGGTGITAEMVLAVAGIGGMLMTGGGADPNWLEDRLNGRARWFSAGPRW